MLSKEYADLIAGYCQIAPKLGYHRHNAPQLTHDVIALVLREHPDIINDVRLNAEDTARHLDGMNIDGIGLMVTARLVILAQRELISDIDAELLRRADAGELAHVIQTECHDTRALEHEAEAMQRRRTLSHSILEDVI